MRRAAPSTPVDQRPSLAPYREANLLDRISSPSALETHYRHAEQRELELVESRLGIRGGEVLSVGCGWHPGRHLFPSPAFRMTAVDADPERVAGVLEAGSAHAAHIGYAGELGFADASFDVVLYRLVLHHVAFQGPLAPCFLEAARLLRPGGALVAIEPGSWHPVGAGLTLANRLHAGPLVHGTPDDIPLSPMALLRESEAAGLRPELHAVTYGWRRLPPRLQRAVHQLDRFGSVRAAALFGHTLLLIARK